MKYKIGAVIDKAQVPSRANVTKYSPILEALAQMDDGAVLPVEFETVEAAKTFQAGSSKAVRDKGYGIRTRGNVAYISRIGK